MTARQFAVTVAAPVTQPTPSAGQAILVAGTDGRWPTNTAMTATNRPAAGTVGLTDARWEYSKFNSYGAGDFVGNFGAKGAYVLAGTGGHSHPDSLDALYFDFNDYTWKVRLNSNGVGPNDATGVDKGFMASQTNERASVPYFRLTYKSLSGEAPAPPHTGLTNVAHPSEVAVLNVINASVTNTGLEHHGYAYGMNLTTGLWTSRSVNACPNTVVNECEAIVVGTRIYLWDGQYIHSRSVLPYLDTADNTWKSVTVPLFPTAQMSGNLRPHILYEPTLSQFLIVYMGKEPRTLDALNFAAAYATPVWSGTVPTFEHTRWVRYSDGSWYTYPGSGGNVLWKITPPATRAGTWAFATVTVGGDALPANPYSTNHYCRFCYVPALNCLAWLPGAYLKVALIKP